jgi:hypothetical protein
MSRISPWILTRGSLIDVMIKNVVTQNKENSIDEASGRRTNDFLSVVTNQGIPGIVDLTDFQENGAMDKEDLHKKFVSGSYITCKIKDINNTNMKLTLSANLDEINSIDERLNFIEAVYGIERKKLIFGTRIPLIFFFNWQTAWRTSKSTTQTGSKKRLFSFQGASPTRTSKTIRTSKH